jgi:hypothetical protein
MNRAEPTSLVMHHAAVASAVRESGYALRRTRIKPVGNQSVLATSDLEMKRPRQEYQVRCWSLEE